MPGEMMQGRALQMRGFQTIFDYMPRTTSQLAPEEILITQEQKEINIINKNREALLQYNQQVEGRPVDVDEDSFEIHERRLPQAHRVKPSLFFEKSSSRESRSSVNVGSSVGMGTCEDYESNCPSFRDYGELDDSQEMLLRRNTRTTKQTPNILTVSQSKDYSRNSNTNVLLGNTTRTSRYKGNEVDQRSSLIGSITRAFTVTEVVPQLRDRKNLNSSMISNVSGISCELSSYQDEALRKHQEIRGDELRKVKHKQAAFKVIGNAGTFSCK